ncbi:MAG TPA: sigma-70 family RNA polymerase sigma factor [Bryobacteraceae bacterium]|nr:sigma-70 family RNA polymerase sigma factor [Bryobacteraceae bacterium]
MTPLDKQVTHAFEECRDDVYRYLLTLGLTPPHAQDAAQEVFLRLYLALRKGESIQNLRGWVFRVAHNLGLDWRAKERTEPLNAGSEALLRDLRPPADAGLIERERMKQIAEAWKTLSAQQRQCLYLRSEGLKYREIAAALGISISTVREFLTRAIARLQKAAHE